jgi:hypothetical protein
MPRPLNEWFSRLSLYLTDTAFHDHLDFYSNRRVIVSSMRRIAAADTEATGIDPGPDHPRPDPATDKPEPHDRDDRQIGPGS